MKILLAADGSDYTRKMLDYVVGHNTLFDKSHAYTVFTAPLPLPNHASSVVGTQATREYYEEEAQKVLQPAQAALTAQGLNATAAWKSGPTGETIAKYAEDGKFDLVIMGSHGHGALARMVMGSVASRVLAHCGVPVLLIR